MRSRDPFLKSKCALLAFGEDELLPPLQAVDMQAYCEYQHFAHSGNPGSILGLLRSIIYGKQGKHVDIEYNISGEDAEVGSGKARIINP